MRAGDSALDVGFGLGYGLEILSEKAVKLCGIDIDRKAVAHVQETLSVRGIEELRHYDGYSIPYSEKTFDAVTCVDVIEHVPDYARLLRELCRVARRTLFLSTPNRRPEHTGPDGKPKNPWHIREWSFDEFDDILKELGVKYEWNFLNGPWEGPFTVTQQITDSTMALAPAILIH